MARDSITARIKTNPELLHRYRTARRLAIGGGVGLGAGLIIGFAGAAIALEAIRAEQDADPARPEYDRPARLGPEFRAPGLVMVGMGATSLVGGLTMMSVGLVQRRNVIRDAHGYPPVAVAPWGGKHGRGAALTGRF